MPLWLTPVQIDALVAQAREGAPREVCGILAGRNGEVREIIPVANIAASPERAYRMDDRALAQALTGLTWRGLEPVAFYHSHPAGDPRPSPLDVAEWAYPDVTLLIIGVRPAPSFMAWSVRWGEVTPVEFVIDTDPVRARRPAWTTAMQVAVLIAVIAAVALFLALAFSLLPPAPPISATPISP